MNWIRVTRKNPCPVCQHPDWCCIGERYANCMRVVSAKPCANGGYLHPLNGHAVAIPRHEPPPRPTIDAPGLMQRWFAQTARAQYDALAETLGVTASALLALKCAWAPTYGAWAFPMRSGAGEVTGIRLRWNNGQKRAITGGRDGIFLPAIEPRQEAVVVEGPTDCAALLTIGKFGIGRPNCNSGIAALAATISRLNIRRAIIIADNDDDKIRPNGDRWNPGLDGAKRLAEEIGVPCCLLVLPTKDAREFVRTGGTAELLDSLTHSLVWHQPKNRSQKPAQQTCQLF